MVLIGVVYNLKLAPEQVGYDLLRENVALLMQNVALLKYMDFVLGCHTLAVKNSLEIRNGRRKELLW